MTQFRGQCLPILSRSSGGHLVPEARETMTRMIAEARAPGCGNMKVEVDVVEVVVVPLLLLLLLLTLLST